MKFVREFTFRRTKSSKRQKQNTKEAVSVSNLLVIHLKLNLPLYSELNCELSLLASGQNSQPVVRLKDSAPPISRREATATDNQGSFNEEFGLNDQAVYSYQQISCLDSVIRYIDKKKLTWLWWLTKVHSAEAEDANWSYFKTK